MHAAHNRLLYGGYILIFIHEDRVVSVRHGCPHARIIQRPQRHMLQIAVVEQILFFFVLRILLLHFFGQAAQRAQCRQGKGHLAPRFLQIGRKHIARLCGQLFHPLAQRYESFRQHGIKFRPFWGTRPLGKARFAAQQRALAHLRVHFLQNFLIRPRRRLQMHGRAGQIQQKEALLI